jgi:hypothetical protein
LTFDFFQKLFEKIQVSLKPNKITGTLHEGVFTFITISRLLFLKLETCRIKFVGKIETHFMFSTFFLRKSCPLQENIDKPGGAREAANDNMAARYMLD